MGGPPVTSRGGMVHLILSLCRQFEEAFGKAVDGGKGGGEQILRVFEERLGQNIQQLQFKKVSLLTHFSDSLGHWCSLCSFLLLMLSGTNLLAVAETQLGMFTTA